MASKLAQVSWGARLGISGGLSLPLLQETLYVLFPLSIESVSWQPGSQLHVLQYLLHRHWFMVSGGGGVWSHLVAGNSRHRGNLLPFERY